MKQLHQPLVTFIVYISRDNLPVHMEGFLSSLVYLKNHNEVQIILINGSSNDAIVDVIKSYDQQLHIFYFKLTNDLGPAYAYNLAMPYVKGTYCHFISPTYTIEPFYLDYVQKTMANNSLNPDLMLLYNAHSLNNYELKNLTYKGLSKELILGLNTNLKHYLINVDFLKQTDVSFNELMFRQFGIVAALILDAHLISYLPTNLISCRFKPVSNYNVYDILYQSYDILSFLNERGVYEKYQAEWDYVLIVNVYYVFLKALAQSNDIDLSSRTSIKDHAVTLSSAINSIRNITNKLRINIQQNPYLQAHSKSVFELYNKILKVIK